MNKYDLNYLKSFSLPKGIGPRHGLINDGIIYFVTEYSNEVYALGQDNKILRSSKTITTDCTSYGATLIIKDGIVYCSNRGEETIALFDINTFKYLKSYPVYGKHSRHMINYEDYIITFNKNSDNVVIIDMKNGEKVLEFEYPQAACGCIIK